MGRLRRSASQRRSLLVPITGGLAVLCAVLGGCSSTPGGVRTTTTTTVPGAATTTTVLPVPVHGSSDTGTAAALGGAERVPVTAVPDHALTVKLPLPGSPGYRSVVPVAYRQLGSGTPLLMIAGEDASMNWWSPALLEALASHYRVTVFDLPGAGYSGAAPEALSMAWLADMTAGLSVELGLQRPVVLGWGMGGQVALALEERHPGLASDVVLVDTGSPVGSSAPMTKVSARILGSASATPADFAKLLFPTDELAARRQWVRSLMLQAPDTVTASTVHAESALEAAYWKSAQSGATAASKVPVLVVAGSADAVFPPADGGDLAAALSGAQHYLWNGEGYGGLIAEPAQFASIIEDFTG